MAVGFIIWETYHHRTFGCWGTHRFGDFLAMPTTSPIPRDTKDKVISASWNLEDILKRCPKLSSRLKLSQGRYTAKQRLILIFSIRQKPIIFMNFKPFLENFLNNSSFFLLLCSMLFYWIRAFFNISFFSYSGKLAIIGANLTMLFLLIYRGLGANHFPLSNHAIKKEYHSDRKSVV